jgi:hypothetical protein
LLRDYAQFNRCYQPIVDERALIPPQINLIRQIYGEAARGEASAPPTLACTHVADYRIMKSSLLNIDD